MKESGGFVVGEGCEFALGKAERVILQVAAATEVAVPRLKLGGLHVSERSHCLPAAGNAR
jgi:hypothetical protein